MADHVGFWPGSKPTEGWDSSATRLATGWRTSFSLRAHSQQPRDGVMSSTAVLPFGHEPIHPDTTTVSPGEPRTLCSFLRSARAHKGTESCGRHRPHTKRTGSWRRCQPSNPFVVTVIQSSAASPKFPTGRISPRNCNELAAFPGENRKVSATCVDLGCLDDGVAPANRSGDFSAAAGNDWPGEDSYTIYSGH